MHHVSVWRRKAVEAFPELTKRIHEDAFSPYALFYEHLFDDWSLREQVAPWLSPHVTRDIWPLWRELRDLRP